MPFQTVVYTDPAYAVEGDFASANPRASMLAGVGELVAGPSGVTIGRFARARVSNGTVTNADPGAANRIGFVHRDQMSIITPFLGEATMLAAAGVGITLFDAGDFWARFAAGATIGQKVFANYADGSASAAAAGTTVAGSAFTASTTNNSPTLTVTAQASGAIAVGQPITGSGIPAGTTVLAFVTGAGGLGTYTMSANATATAAGVSMTTAGAKETQWWVHSAAAAGELAQISTRVIS